MKNVVIFVCAILLISCSKKLKPDNDYIKNYYQLIYSADVEFESKNYRKAFEFYQKAFNNCDPINTPEFNELRKFTELCAIIGKDKLASEFIEKNLKIGSEIKWYMNDSIYSRVFKTRKGKELLRKYDEIHKNFLKNVNMELRKEIQEMQRLDQLYRRSNQIKQDSIDIVNTKKIILIFNEYGYPNEKIIGNSSIDKKITSISTILLHTKDSIRMNYFVPKLTEYVKNGQCSPKTLGFLIDQFHLYNGNPQTHGTYRSQNSKYATMITDKTEINRNRISIGLPTLEMQEKIDSLRQIRYPELFNK